jgi:hypothetical protein
MTHTEMLKSLIDCVDRFSEAQMKYEKQVGGGAAQKKKNQLFKEMKQRFVEMNNASFNIKQFLK